MCHSVRLGFKSLTPPPVLAAIETGECVTTDLLLRGSKKEAKIILMCLLKENHFCVCSKKKKDILNRFGQGDY